MLSFQNRAPYIKLLKVHTNWDKKTYLKKRNFQQKFVCQIWYRYWICGIETNLEVLLDLDYEFRLALYAKQDNVKLTFLTVNLEKCHFLQTTPNIGNIYHWKEFFSASMYLGSLPQNKAPFVSNQGLKFSLQGKYANFFCDETWQTWKIFMERNLKNFEQTSKKRPRVQEEKKGEVWEKTSSFKLCFGVNDLNKW